jgi:hypothetical protein
MGEQNKSALAKVARLAEVSTHTHDPLAATPQIGFFNHVRRAIDAKAADSDSIANLQWLAYIDCHGCSHILSHTSISAE